MNSKRNVMAEANVVACGDSSPDRSVRQRRRSLAVLSGLVVAVSLAGLPRPGNAHGSSVGDIEIDHPYATPTAPGATVGAVYFRGLSNSGKRPDRLVSASTPVAASIEFHRNQLDGDVMRMRAIDAIELPAGAALNLRHTGELHLMLVGLKTPLVDGQTFPMRLRFEHAGEQEVKVWVQTPRERGEPHRH